jgi:transcriptional regulator with XRE-family HTH domain
MSVTVVGFFSDRLHELRQKAKLTQKQLSERSGLPEGSIRQIEAGRREPVYKTLVKLARGLGVHLNAFEPPVGWNPDDDQAEDPPKPPKRNPKRN